MKILFFIENLRAGGKERRLVELLKGVQAYPDVQAELVLTRQDIHYRDVLSLNLKIHVIERRGLKKDPRLFFKFYKIARAFQPDIIHVWGNMVAFYAIPAKIILKIPMINSQITDAPNKISKGALSQYFTFFFSNLILSNSKAGIKSYKTPLDKSKVIYNGFNFKRIENLKSKNDVKKKLQIKSNLVVGMVAGFKPLKDNATYLKAANLVLSKFNNVVFLCIGPGDSSPYLKYIDSFNIKNVYFLGQRENVEEIMNICDIGILTSYNEGIPNTIMEFMSLKKPVIVTDGGGIRELVVDYKAGYIIPQQNYKILSEKIIQLLSDGQKRKKFGNYGKKFLEKYFNIDKMILEHYKVYKSFANKN